MSGDVHTPPMSAVQEAVPVQSLRLGEDHGGSGGPVAPGSDAASGLSVPGVSELRAGFRTIDGPLGLLGIGDLVKVTWQDAAFDFDEPVSHVDDDYLVETVGYVYAIGTKRLRLAAERTPDGHRAVTGIPLVCIENIEEVGSV